jgi:hypothetical protein
VKKLKSIDSFISSSKTICGFIDERGNFGYDFEKEGVSSHFVISAILVEGALLQEIECKVEEVRKKFFQNGEMKSSNVGKNHQRRLLILEKLKELNFKIFTVIVDKRKIIQSSGLGWKKSFIKFLNGLLYQELHNYFPKLKLTADEHGSKEFMEGFKQYLLREHIPNLFGEYEFGFGNSKSEILIQLADFICGTIAMGYEHENYHEEHNQYMELLGNKLLPVLFWPYEPDEYIKKLDQYKGNTFDKNIAFNSVKLATKYVENNTNSKDPDILERVYVLKYLLSMLISQKSNEYISSKDIINNLHEITGRDYTPHYFKTRIIAKLRDAGVLISSSQSGYKIPIREKEILAFVNQTSLMVKPMLQRLKICRNRVLSATGNEFDVLAFKEYEYIKAFFDKEKTNDIT